MSTISHRRESFAGERQDEISEFCQGLFAPFARSDQRRWGEVYLRGLLHAQGRKTLPTSPSMCSAGGRSNPSSSSSIRAPGRSKGFDAISRNGSAP